MTKKNLNLEGLETVTNETVTNEVKNVNFSDLNWLEENSPIFPEEIVSLKFKKEREPKVQNGIEKIAGLDKNAPKLFLLLAKWWENKEARKTIKDAIDAQAKSESKDPIFYMQNTLREFAQNYAGLSDAVDRMLYITTYYKPRGGVKDTFKIYMIDNKMYNVNLRILSELKAKGLETKQLLDEIKEVSELVEMESL